MLKKIWIKTKGVLQLPLYIIVKFLNTSKLLLIISFPILLILIIRDWFVFRKTSKGEDRTYNVAAYELGYYCYISGELGAGKTTFMAGISHFYQQILINKANQAMEKCKKIVFDFNYVTLNEFVREERSKGLRYEEIHKIFIKSELYGRYIGLYYDDGINKNYFDKLFFNYIRAYYRLLDYNFVMSNISIESRLTENFNKVLKKSYLKIKNGECPIEKYNVLLYDESTLDENNIHTQEIVAADDGQTEFLRLIRHFGEETIFLLLTAQVMNRDVLQWRELANSEVKIIGRSIKRNFVTKSFIYNIQSKLLSREKRMYRNLFVNDRYTFENTYNKFKKREFELMRKIDRVNARAYLKYHVVIKLKGKGEAYEDVLLLPINWCYGTTDTHHFKFIFDYIKMEQKLSYYDLKVAEDLTWEEKVAVAKELLKSKKREKPVKKTRAERSEENRKKHAEETAKKEAERKAAKEKKKTVDNESTDNADLSSNENGEM